MSEIVIKAENISKAYKIYENDFDRVKEALNPFHKRCSKDFFEMRDVPSVLLKIIADVL